MTGKQIEEAKKELRIPFKDMTPKQRRLDEELSCREMINSCLTYGNASCGFYNADTKEFGHYAEAYIKSLGKRTVIRLYNEQAEDFSKAIVSCGVYTDHEGCTYNTCTWADEQ